MFRSLHTSSPVVHMKSTVNIQIRKGCHNVKVSLKIVQNFYLTIFMAINTNIMNKTSTKLKY